MGLFLKIKREETVHILNRLTNVPRDICNVSRSLLSRKLINDDFVMLKKAYLKLDSDDDYREEYYVQFFQHFFDKILKDNDLRGTVGPSISECVSVAFENDMIEVTSKFAEVLSKQGVFEYKVEINYLFHGLSNSEHKENTKIYQNLFNHLKTKKQRFEFFDTIESPKNNFIAKIEFGKILHNEYSNSKLEESEKESFIKLNKLIEKQKNNQTK